jgi:hypothetical protein
LIIGAMKCGTSSLYHYLKTHPEIYMTAEKEPDFFFVNWNLGVDWYEGLFNTEKSIRGEASTNYTKFPQFADVPQKIFQVLPQAKLIYIMRDPIQRIISHYLHRRIRGKEKKSFKEAVTTNPAYLNVSRYYLQIEQYLAYYPRASIKAVLFEDLVHKKREALQDIFHFLGADPSFWSPSFEYKHHVSDEKDIVPYNYVKKMEQTKRGRKYLKYIPRGLKGMPNKRPVPSKELKSKIYEALKDDLEKLKKFLGRSLEEWEIN